MVAYMVDSWGLTIMLDLDVSYTNFIYAVVYVIILVDDGNKAYEIVDYTCILYAKCLFYIWMFYPSKTKPNNKTKPNPKQEHTEYTYHIHIAFAVLFWYTQYEFVMYKLLHITY